MRAIHNLRATIKREVARARRAEKKLEKVFAIAEEATHDNRCAMVVNLRECCNCFKSHLRKLKEKP